MYFIGSGLRCGHARLLTEDSRRDGHNRHLSSGLEQKCIERSTSLARQLGQPSLEESPLRLLLGEAQGLFVGGSGFRRAPESPAEIRPCRVRQMIVPEITAREDSVDVG